jgi:hypothetical protein
MALTCEHGNKPSGFLARFSIKIPLHTVSQLQFRFPARYRNARASHCSIWDVLALHSVAAAAVVVTSVVWRIVECSQLFVLNTNTIFSAVSLQIALKKYM